MNLSKLYQLQQELDNHILVNEEKRDNKVKDKAELLDETILALLVEVGELANTTRCFKHWSTKGMMEKEVVLDELADVYHFYLSIGNQLNIQVDKLPTLDEGTWQALEDEDVELKDVFLSLYSNISEMGIEYPISKDNYILAGQDIYVLELLLQFADEEVEKAYLKKHEENYKRQREGY